MLTDESIGGVSQGRGDHAPGAPRADARDGALTRPTDPYARPVGVAEGRQIACDEIQRYGALGFDDLVGRNESGAQTVRGPSGRSFQLTTMVFDDYDGSEGKVDRDDYFQGVAVVVEAVGPGRLPLKFREAVVLAPNLGETVGDLSSRPMTYIEEVQHRTLDVGCLALLAPLLALLFLSAKLGVFGEEDEPG